ncbi:MAG: Maf family protein [Tepidiformaceae bacterium]
MLDPQPGSTPNAGPVVLASASPRRSELLRALIDEFDVLPSDVPEPLSGDPRQDAVQLAIAKARAVAAERPHALVIGADTIVYEGTNLYGKPADAAHAVAMWTALRGREHVVVTGIALLAGNETSSDWSESHITLSNLTDAEVAAYVASGRPMDKAGAYAIQDEDIPTVAARGGCYCSTMGLPLWRLGRMLAVRGIACREPHASLPRCAICPERDAGQSRR